MDNTLIITDEEITDLKNKIDSHKKREEYDQLKKDLFEITYKANNTLTEFDGGMKQVDTERVLSDKYRKQTFSEIFISRFIKMCAIRPITGNLIAITLAIVAICSLNLFLNNPDLKTLKLWIQYFIELAAGIQILKTASRSLILPVCATIIGAVVSNQITGNQSLLQQPHVFYQALMVTGLIGIAISVFSID